MTRPRRVEAIVMLEDWCQGDGSHLFRGILQVIECRSFSFVSTIVNVPIELPLLCLLLSSMLESYTDLGNSTS